VEKSADPKWSADFFVISVRETLQMSAHEIVGNDNLYEKSSVNMLVFLHIPVFSL
jgi:hypothetical protein